jgi:hypothetical protein
VVEPSSATNRNDVRLPAPLRPPPSLRDVERALLLELSRYGDAKRRAPNAWNVELSSRDHRKRQSELPRWSTALSDRLVDEHRRLGLPASGLVTVAFTVSGDVVPGHFRVAGAVVATEPAVARRPDLLRGRPRLTLPAGGTVRHGTPAAAGIDREVFLPAGSFVVGRAPDADLRLHDETVSPRHVVLDVAGDRVRLRDIGSLNGTSVDGVPAVAVDLVNGNRIQLGDTTLVFSRDDTEDEGGREGGEGE